MTVPDVVPGAMAGPAAPCVPTLTLYGRQWCHLCEDMLAALAPLAAEFGVQVEVIDVDADPALEARYDELVPVLTFDGAELSRYRLDEPRVRAALAAWRGAGPRPTRQNPPDEGHFG